MNDKITQFILRTQDTKDNMISEIAILNLQAVAAFLMGYDYLLSKDLKEKANAISESSALTYKNQIDEKLKLQIEIFRSWLPSLYTGLLYILIVFILYFVIELFMYFNLGVIGSLISVLLLFPFIWYSYRAAAKIANATANGITPFLLPVLARALTSFLLYSSKGVIAALGFVFLLASFVCRYINIYNS